MLHIYHDNYQKNSTARKQDAFSAYRCQGTGQCHLRYTKLQLLYQSSPNSCKPLQLAMGSSIILELHEDGTFYLVRQFLKSRAISSTGQLFNQQPHLIIGGPLARETFYLQAFNIIWEQIINQFLQSFNRNPIQYSPCVTYLKSWFHCPDVLTPRAICVMLYPISESCLDRILIYI